MYCLSAALCTVLWVNGKIFNVCVLVVSKKFINPKKSKNKGSKNCMCAVSILGIKQNYLHTFYMLCIHINVS